MSDIIYGKNPVMEALKAGRPINKIITSREAGGLKAIFTLAKNSGIPIQNTSKTNLDKIFSGNHQGVIAFTSQTRYYDIEDLLKEAKLKNEDPFILILDEIEDPHNLGAIIRTAYATGAHGIIIPKRRAAPVTDIVAKTSAGAVEHLKIARVSNIVQAMEKLKANGCWIAGSDLNGDDFLWDHDLKGPLALVIGNEGKGLSRLTKEKCDFLIKIPMKGKVSSLNASVAAAVLCYEVMRQTIQG